MAKQAKMKKGSIGKKALAAILAASMVLSSSAFSVLASPIEETITVTLEAATYDGTVKEPKVTKMVYGSGTDIAQTVPTNYEVKYSGNPVNVGDEGAYVIDFSKGDYAGTAAISGTYEVTPLTISNPSQLTGTWKAHSGFTYNGKDQTPEVESVVYTDGGKEISLPLENFKFAAASNSEDSDLKSAGKKVAKLELTDLGKNNIDMTGEATMPSYEIMKAPFNTDNVKITSKPVAFTGSMVEPNVVVTDNEGNKITEGWDYVYKKNGSETTDCPNRYLGTYDIIIRSDGTGNFEKGDIPATYTITDKDLDVKVQEAADKVTSGADAIFGASSGYAKNDKGVFVHQYDGKEHINSTEKTAIETWLKNTVGLSAEEFSLDLSGAKGTDVGSYKIVINGEGDRKGQTTELPLEITSKALTKNGEAVDATFVTDIDASITVGKTHNNEVSKTAAVELKDKTIKPDGTNPYTLVNDKDYTYSVGTPTSDGKVVVKVVGQGNWTGTVNYEVTSVGKMSLSDPSIEVTLTPDSYEWTGKQIKPDVSTIKVVENSGTTPYTLTYPGDFDIVAYGTNTDAGEGTVTLKVSDNKAATEAAHYQGEVVKKFKIVGTDVNDVFEIAPIADKVLNSKPAPVKDALAQGGGLKVVYKSSGNVEPTENVLDTIKAEYYIDGVSADATAVANVTKGCTVKIVIPAKGKYSGSLTAEYKILGEDGTSSVTIDNIADCTYTGEAIEPDVTVKKDTTTLVKGTAYDLDWADNVEAGVAKAIVTLKGEYSGTIEKAFTIKKADGYAKLTSAQENALAEGMGVGDKDCVPNLVGYITAGDKQVNDATLKVESMSSSDESVARITDDKTIEYVGKGTATVTITPASDNLNVSAFDVTVKVTSESATTGIKTPTFTPSNKISKKARTFTVTTCKVSGATQWKVKYSLKSSMKSSQTRTYASNRTSRLYRKAITCNKSKRKYYIQVRAYVPGKGWSSWSPKKSITSR